MANYCMLLVSLLSVASSDQSLLLFKFKVFVLNISHGTNNIEFSYLLMFTKAHYCS